MSKHGKVGGIAARIIFSAIFIFSALFVSHPPAFAGGEDTIFPLEFPLPFPWTSIDGIWKVDTLVAGKPFKVHFSFEVQQDCDNRKILRVVQIDPASLKTLADGIGYENTDSQQVYAAMQNRDGTSYVLYVGAFRDSQHSTAQTKLVMRISRFNNWTPEQNFRIEKLPMAPAKVAAAETSTCKTSKAGVQRDSNFSASAYYKPLYETDRWLGHLFSW